MRSFGSSITALVIIGFFGITTWSAPFPWDPPTNYRPQPTSPKKSSSSSSGSSSGSTTSSAPSTGSSTASTGSGGIVVSAGSGTPGYATVVNKCSVSTWVHVCKQNPATCTTPIEMAATTGTYSEAYAPRSDGGHSLKIALVDGTDNTIPILQLEYTMNEGNTSISYDLSEVNGNPFGPWGFSLTNSTTDVFCKSPATDCPNIFTDPTNGIPYTAPISDGVGTILCG